MATTMRPEGGIRTRDLAQHGRRRGIGGGQAHGTGQVSQGVAPVSGAPPLPAGSLCGVPPSAPPPPPDPRTRRAHPRWRSAPPPPSCWCVTPPDELGGTSLEVLMVRRNLRSDFVGGAYVFPGGAVDPLDGGPEAEACAPAGPMRAPAPCWASSRGASPTGSPSCARPSRRRACCCPRAPAAPTCWPGIPRRRPASPPPGAKSTRGTRRFLDLCRNERLRLSAGEIHYFAHWITPRGARVVTTPASSSHRHRPARSPRTTPGRPSPMCGSRRTTALARHRAGEIEIIFPTIRNLQVIGRFATSAALLEAAEEASSAVPAIEPRVVPDGNGMRIVLPGDPGYERGAVPDPGDGSAAATSTRRCAPSPCAPTTRVPTTAPGSAALQRATSPAVIPAVPDFGLGPAPVPGRVDEVAPGVRRLTAPNPGLMTGPGYEHLPRGGLRPVVVDPGPADEVAHRRHRGGRRPSAPSAPSSSPTPTSIARPGCRRARHRHGCPRRRLRPGGGLHARRVRRGGVDACPAGHRTGRGDLTSARAGTRRATPRTTCAGWSRSTRCSPATTSCTARRWSSARPDGDLHQYLASLARLATPQPRHRARWRRAHGRLMDHVPDSGRRAGGAPARAPRDHRGRR